MYVLGQKGLCFVSQTHPVVPSLIWSLCSSDRRFAVRFLQISRHREHPCVKLTVTSVFTARDLHPIDYAHAGRTKKRRIQSILRFLFTVVGVGIRSAYPSLFINQFPSIL